MTQDPRILITQLLKNLGSQREVEQYLKQYADLESTKFAVIKVGGGIIRDHLEELCTALTFLSRVALYPIVIHGAGEQLSDALREAGHEPRFIDGKRVTDATTLTMAQQVFSRVNHQICDALEAMGTRARPIPMGVFKAKPADFETMGYVGEVEDLDLDPIRSAIRSKAIPILSSLAISETGQLLNVNADLAAASLAVALGAEKLMVLTDPVARLALVAAHLRRTPAR